MKFLEWKKDRWFSREGSILPYDKVEHSLLAFSGVLLLSFFIPFTNYLPIETNQMFIRTLGVIWEIINGTIAYDGINVQGFSWKDLIANEAGLRFAGDFIFITSLAYGI